MPSSNRYQTIVTTKKQKRRERLPQEYSTGNPNEQTIPITNNPSHMCPVPQLGDARDGGDGAFTALLAPLLTVVAVMVDGLPVIVYRRTATT